AGTTSGLSVSSGAALNARGNITTSGSLTSSSGGTVDLTDTAITTVTVGSTLGLATTTLGFELGSGSASDRIAATGVATVNGTNTINFGLAAGQSVVPGNSYQLITASAGLSAPNFTVGSKAAFG